MLSADLNLEMQLVKLKNEQSYSESIEVHLYQHFASCANGEKIPSTIAVKRQSKILLDLVLFFLRGLLGEARKTWQM
jgi:hypothetical protein